MGKLHMNSIELKYLGRSEIKVSLLGMGCWAIGGPFRQGNDELGWGHINEVEAIAALHKARESGINFFDTADVYGAGNSERILGKAFSEKRDKIVLATKFGITFKEETREVTGTNASAEYIQKACEASLGRLNTDYIDLYQFHLNDYDILRADEVVDTLENLVSQGKIRKYGWSTDFIDRASVFEKGKNCVAIQHQMNVLDDADEMIRFCEKTRLASINRGPLAMGLLTGKYSENSDIPNGDVRGKNSPEWMQYFQKGKANSEYLFKMNAIREILTSSGRTLVQGAMAWIWARSKQTIPIPGFENIAQVEENCLSMKFGPLNEENLLEIDKILGR